jgi:hypothetical protein
MNDTIIVCFSGIGPGPGLPIGEEFIGVRGWKDVDSLYYIDEARSFFNKVDVASLIKKVEGYQKVIALGNSLGAFNANCLAQVTKVDAVISFAAVYSVLPYIVPFEKKWIKFQHNGGDWKFDHMKFNDTTKYYFISGDDEREQQHLTMVPDAPNVIKNTIQNCGHNVAMVLAKQKKLYPMIKEIVNGI